MNWWCPSERQLFAFGETSARMLENRVESPIHRLRWVFASRYRKRGLTWASVRRDLCETRIGPQTIRTKTHREHLLYDSNQFDSRTTRFLLRDGIESIAWSVLGGPTEWQTRATYLREQLAQLCALQRQLMQKLLSRSLCSIYQFDIINWLALWISSSKLCEQTKRVRNKQTKRLETYKHQWILIFLFFFD